MNVLEASYIYMLYAKIRLYNVVIRLENKAFKGAHRAERAFNN